MDSWLVLSSASTFTQYAGKKSHLSRLPPHLPAFYSKSKDLCLLFGDCFRHYFNYFPIWGDRMSASFPWTSGESSAFMCTRWLYRWHPKPVCISLELFWRILTWRSMTSPSMLSDRKECIGCSWYSSGSFLWSLAFGYPFLGSVSLLSSAIALFYINAGHPSLYSFLVLRTGQLSLGFWQC